MRDTRAINRFLLGLGLKIRNNPAISPDLCLDPHSLERAVRADLPQLGAFLRESAAGDGRMRRSAGLVDLFPASELLAGIWRLFVVEERASGDAGFLVEGAGPIPLPGAIPLGDRLQLVPLLWDGLAPLKNLLLADDPGSTVFPVARGTLSRSSIVLRSSRSCACCPIRVKMSC